jgi:hypothetical protein
LQDPLKFTQNSIFGLKINHLATLEDIRVDGESAEHVPLRTTVFACDRKKIRQKIKRKKWHFD